jgi:uncharacterized protein YbjT (DUF2867 family)
MIAVMGAAGNVGGKVADLLLGQGREVRVLEHTRGLDDARGRGADVVAGDAVNVEDLRALFDHADAAFVLLPENPSDPQFVATRSRISRALAQALRERPVRHVVALSAVGADRADAAGPPAGLHEYEQRLAELEDVHLLVLRPTSYMEYLLGSLPLIRSRRINGSAIEGDLRFPMIATQDVAREAAERLVRRDFSGHEQKLLLGPEDVSMKQATLALGRRLGIPDLPYVRFEPAEMKGALIAAGMSGEVAGLLVDMQLALNEGRFFDGVERTAETTTPTRLEEFLLGALPDEARREEHSR